MKQYHDLPRICGFDMYNNRGTLRKWSRSREHDDRGSRDRFPDMPDQTRKGELSGGFVWSQRRRGWVPAHPLLRDLK